MEEYRMLPSAVTSTGPYAGFWSYLRTLEHALDRAAEADAQRGRLAPLDVDRLSNLASFLRAALRAQASSAELTNEFLAGQPSAEPDYRCALDLRTRIRSLQSFAQWRRSSKEGYERKLRALIDTIEEYVATAGPELIAHTFPHQEATVLRELLDSLLLDAETALHDQI